MTETPLDRAAMLADAPDAGDAERAHYYEVFAAAEFFLAIEPETLESDAPQPLLFPVEEVNTALIFDREDRLAAFMGGEGVHLALSGRAVLSMFSGRRIQIGVNLGDAPSATILPVEAVDWAVSALHQPIEAERNAGVKLTAPKGAAPELLARIDSRLAGMAEYISEAWLCGREGEGLILCLALRTDGAESAVVSALAETAQFAGGDRPAFDIAVLEADDAGLSVARAQGFGFEVAVASHVRAIPGADPAKPPKLR